MADFDTNFGLELFELSTWMIVLMLSFSVHEASHAWIALKRGDNTAANLGRITLNPLSHIEVLGTLIIPIISFVTSGIMFGWAKPVPINPFRLRSSDIALVAAAGPLSNLLLALIFALLHKVILMIQLTLSEDLFINLNYFSLVGIKLNIILFLFNLLPIFPLDGSKIAFCPYKVESSSLLNQYSKISPLLLMFMMMQGIVFELIEWPTEILYNLLT